MDSERYSRQIMLPEIGAEGQRLIRASSVLIVGLGGLGSPVAMYLAGAGVGRIGLCDADTVSLSNLHRQVLYSSSKVGLPKAACAARRLKGLSPDTEFVIIDTALTGDNARNIIGGYDLVIDCTDNYMTRYLLDEVCFELGKPWIHGSIGAFDGCVSILNGKKKLRYIDIFPDRELLENSVSFKGVAGPVPGVIGAIQAAQALQWIVGMQDNLDGRLFTIDIKTLQTNIIDFN